jgi:tripartite-type tricarboxylate transporter receptor subunit TctC
MRKTIITAIVLAVGMFVLCGWTGALADDYPSKDITTIVPFKPGGGTDTSMRLLQKPLERILGVKLNFVYKTGASGVMGYLAVAASKPDGYTIGAVNWPHVLVPTIVKDKPGYNLEDLQPIGTYNKDVAVLGVHPDSPWKTLTDLVEDAKKRPEQISVAHPVRLGYSIKAAYEFEDSTGAKLKHVYFDGGSASKQAFLGKHVDVWIINGSVMRKVKDKVRPLAVMGAERVGYYPDVPTFGEAGYKEVEVYTYRALVTKAGTDPAKIDVLADAIDEAVSDPEFQKKMLEKGVEPFSLDTKELQEFSKETLERIESLYLKYEKM